MKSRPITLRRISPVTGKMEELKTEMTVSEIRRLKERHSFGDNLSELFPDQPPAVWEFLQTK